MKATKHHNPYYRKQWPLLFRRPVLRGDIFICFRIVGARNVVSKLTFNILLSFITQQFLLTDINSGR